MNRVNLKRGWSKLQRWLTQKADITDLSQLPFRELRLGLLAFYLLTMPLVIYLGNTEYGYTKTIYTFVFLSFVLLIWLVELGLSRSYRITLTKLILPVLLLVVGGLLSLINATSWGTVIQSLGVFVYFVLFYLLVVNTVESFSDVKLLLFSLLLSATGATVYGLLQLFGVVAGARGLRAGAGNIISTMGNQNYLGGFISYLFVPGVMLLFLIKSRWIRSLLVLVLLSFFIILFPIGARGSWLALAIAAVFFLVGVGWLRPLQFIRREKRWIVLLIVGIVGAYLVFGSPGVLNSVVSLPASPSNDQPWGLFTPVVRPLVREVVKKGGARVEDWYIGMEMLRDHPFFGIGLGHYKIRFLDYRAKFLTTPEGQRFKGHVPRGAQAHNEYVQFAAEMGGVGMGFILLALGGLVWFSVRRFVRVEEKLNRLFFLSLFGSCVGVLFHSAVSFPFHLPASVLPFALFLGFIHSGVGGDKELTVSLGKVGKYLLVTLGAVFLISVSVLAYRDWRANIYLDRGLTQMKFGNYRLAEGLLRESKRLDFCPRQVYFYLGVTERELGRNDRALEYFEKCRFRFQPYKFYLHLGSLYLDQGQLNKAHSILTTFVNMSPQRGDELEARYFLATVELKLGNVELAQKRAQRILDRDSNFQRGWIIRGDIYRARGDHQKAIESWEKALRIVERKLSDVNSTLQGSLSLDRYHELRTRKKVLREEKRTIEERLNQQTD